MTKPLYLQNKAKPNNATQLPSQKYAECSVSMSHSTTATSTYVLVKYSRSYPKNPNAATAHSQQGRPQTENPSEWQHFTNPIIRLVLDARKKATSELESVRMRILWSMDSGDLSDQTDVVFEDLDLVLFSFIYPQSQSHELPLKAVYRDSVVGIRYLHPREVTTPTYRRFQITFECPSAASQFIDSICSVCPCKANNPGRRLGNMNPPVKHRTTTVMTGSTAPSMPRQTQTSLHLSSFSSQTAHLPRNWQLVSEETTPSILGPSSSHSDRMKFQSSPPITGGIGHQASPPPASGSCLGKATSSVSMFAAPYDNLAPASSYLVIPRGVLPPSSPPALLPSSSTEDPIPPPFTAPGPPIIPAITASLQEPSTLYNLSQSSLEGLIGDVVREDGFIKLLKQVSSMWRIRNLIPTDRHT